MSPTKRKCFVRICLPGEKDSVPAGVFEWDANRGEGFFAYGNLYSKRHDAIAVDPVSLPLGGRQIFGPETNNGGFFGSIRDAIPDYWGRQLHCKLTGTDESMLTDFDLLLTPDDRVGNLSFRETLDPEPPVPPFSLADISRIIREVGQDISLSSEILKRILTHGTSIGGARPKLTMDDEEEHWICKFPAKDDEVDYPTVEYATFRLAEKAGISIPKVRLVSVEGVNVLLSKRFDRTPSGRLGFLSGLSFLQRDERDRTFGYPDFAMELLRQGDLAGQKELFSRMIFNAMVHNTDDHARNFGFLYDGRRVFLSPAYDIGPVIATPGVGTQYQQAVIVGNESRVTTRDNLLSDHSRFGLSKNEAMSRIRQLHSVVLDWKRTFLACGVQTADIRKLEWSFEVAKKVFDQADPSWSTADPQKTQDQGTTYVPGIER